MAESSNTSKIPRHLYGQSLVIQVKVHLFIIHSFLAFIVILANLLLIIVILKNRKLRKVSSTIMLSLAFADLGVGITTLTPVIYAIFSHTMVRLHCNIIGFMFCLSWMVSLYTIMLLSADRLVAIVNPFRYKNICSWTTCILCILFIWGFSTTLWAFSLAGYGTFYLDQESIICKFNVIRHPIKTVVDSIMIFFPPVVVTLTCYYRIWTVSHWHGQRLQSLKPYTSTPVKVEQKHVSFRSSSQVGMSKQSRRALGTVVIIVGVFYVSWIPFMADNISEAIVGDAQLAPGWAHMIMHMLAITNSLWNPIIYMSTDRKVRKASLRLLVACCPMHLRTRYFERSLSGTYSFSFLPGTSSRSRITFLESTRFSQTQTPVAPGSSIDTLDIDESPVPISDQSPGSKDQSPVVITHRDGSLDQSPISANPEQVLMDQGPVPADKGSGDVAEHDMSQEYYSTWL